MCAAFRGAQCACTDNRSARGKQLSLRSSSSIVVLFCSVFPRSWVVFVLAGAHSRCVMLGAVKRDNKTSKYYFLQLAKYIALHCLFLKGTVGKYILHFCVFDSTVQGMTVQGMTVQGYYSTGYDSTTGVYMTVQSMTVQGITVQGIIQYRV